MSREALRWVDGMRPMFKGKRDVGCVALLQFLAIHADDRQEVWWGEDKMRERLCMGRQAFRDRKRVVVEQGYVVVEEQRHKMGARKGQRTNDLWRLRLDRVADVEAPATSQPSNLLRGREQQEGPATDNPSASGVDTRELYEVHTGQQSSDRTLTHVPAVGPSATDRPPDVQKNNNHRRTTGEEQGVLTDSQRANAPRLRVEEPQDNLIPPPAGRCLEPDDDELRDRPDDEEDMRPLIGLDVTGRHVAAHGPPANLDGGSRTVEGTHAQDDTDLPVGDRGVGERQEQRVLHDRRMRSQGEYLRDRRDEAQARAQQQAAEARGQHGFAAYWAEEAGCAARHAAWLEATGAVEGVAPTWSTQDAFAGRVAREVQEQVAQRATVEAVATRGRGPGARHPSHRTGLTS